MSGYPVEHGNAALLFWRRFAVRFGDSVLRRRLLHGAAWSLAGVALEKLVTLVVVIVTVRLLAREQYGLLAVVQSTSNTLAVFALFGMGTTATRFVARLKQDIYPPDHQLQDHDPHALSGIVALLYHCGIAFSLLLMFGVICSAGLIASDVMAQPALAGPLTLLALALGFITLDGIQQGVLLGYERVRQLGIINLAAVLLAAPLHLVMTWQYGLNGAVGGLMLTAFLRWLFSALAMRQCIRIDSIKYFRGNLRKHGAVLKTFALPALLSGAMITPVHWLCHGMLMRTPHGAADMAIVGVGAQWFYLLLFVPATAGKILLPILSELAVRDTGKKAARILMLNVVCNLLTVLPLLLLLAGIGDWIMRLYGPQFAQHGDVLLLYVAAAALAAACLPLGYFLAASGGMWMALAINAGWAIVYVCGSRYFLDHGAAGVASGLLLAYAVHLVSAALCAYWLSRRLSQHALSQN